jgi:GNAT superfamily N-acetyltransferase
MQVQLQQAHTRQVDEIEPLVAAYHAFEAIPSSASSRASALRMLLGDSSLGALWLIHVDAKLAGYIALCRGFSIEFNGFDAFIDEFFLLPGFRGRGVGRQVLTTIGSEARKLEINALHLEVARDNTPARKLYASVGFEPREKYLLMSLPLRDDSGDGHA